jgi:hypothetical protein
MEVDRSFEDLLVPESSRHVLHPLNFGIQRLADCVCDSMLQMASIQVPPHALRLMIVKSAFGTTFRAIPARVFGVLQENVSLPTLQLELDSINMPRLSDTRICS